MIRLKLLINTLLFFFCLLVSYSGKGQWIIIDTVNTGNLKCLYFMDNSTGFAAGQIGERILKTSDGGTTWAEVPIPVPLMSANIFDLEFVNSNVGYACGGSLFANPPNFLLATYDGGETWQDIENNNTTGAEFIGLDFIDEDNGILFSYHFLYRASDGGYTLQSINKPYPNFVFTDAVTVGDSSIVVAGWYDSAGSFVNRICYTTDWGDNWTISFASDLIGVQSLAVMNNEMWAGGSSGKILHSLDHGQTWSIVYSGNDTFWFDKVRVNDQGNLYALGYNLQNNGYIFHTDDGINWQIDTINNIATDIAMLSSDTGYLSTFNEIYKTTNNGGFTTSVSKWIEDDRRITIYPNPANHTAKVDFLNQAKERHAYLVNVSGQIVQHYGRVPGSSIEITGDNLASGAYYLIVKEDNIYLSRQLLFIKHN